MKRLALSTLALVCFLIFLPWILDRLTYRRRPRVVGVRQRLGGLPAPRWYRALRAASWVDERRWRRERRAEMLSTATELILELLPVITSVATTGLGASLALDHLRTMGEIEEQAQ